MSGDLTTSAVARQNILNNPYALDEIEKAAGIRGIPFDGRRVVLKEAVADFFEVSIRTIDTYLDKHGPELAQNGYETLKGKRLKSFKESVAALDAHELNFTSIGKVSQLGVFDFRAFLNLAMLLSESERARLLRQAILDIAIDTVNRRTGGSTKYINQRDEEFLQAQFSGDSYRKQFTDALKDCVAMGNFKYALYTDKVYEAIFLEKAREYRKVLKLEEADRTRDTFYSEILDLIAAFEFGITDALRKDMTRLGRQLTPKEVDSIFVNFSNLPHWKPLMESARAKMASRDLAFRDALHERLKGYVTPVQRADFERFLGEKSKELSKRLEEAKDVLKRLKDR
jgi:hypothetical protein